VPADPPNLVDQAYADILAALLQRIPGYTPEWTDWNESDPGRTFVELIAWLGESMGYRLNQVPAASYGKFVELIGLTPQPALPSRVYLSFTATPASTADPIMVPQGTAVSAAGSDGKPVYFETDSGLGLTRYPLAQKQVFDGTPHGVSNGAPFRPFGAAPSPGNAVYLGFGPANPAITLPPFPDEITLHVVVPSASSGAVQTAQVAAQPQPAPPVTVQWEYLAAAEPAQVWRPLALYADTSAAFTRQGDISVEGPPRDIAAQANIGDVAEPHYWIRCRLTGGAYLGAAPVVTSLQENTVRATSLRTVTGEPVGQSSGLPGQQMALANSPVSPASMALTVASGEQSPVPWTAVEDFYPAGPTDTVYVLDAIAGTVTFGDGDHGLIPPAGSLITASYRYGGGAGANVPAGAASALQGPVPGIAAVTNASAAAGGQDAQSVDELKQQAPAMLRSQQRVVTAADYIAQAIAVPGVGRATVVPLANPAFPGVAVPGALTVVIVPSVLWPGDDVPLPPPMLKEAVGLKLEDMRPVAAEVYVDGPTFHMVTLIARIEVQPYASPDQVRLNVTAALDAALWPLPLPQPDGSVSTPRDFGADFYPSSLYRAILEVSGVVAVPILAVSVDGLEIAPTGSVTLAANELLAAAGQDRYDLTVVPQRSGTVRYG
jgi:predicted phage baseplate assembly protein